MGIEWNKVTRYSKLIAVLLFIAVSVLAFKLGRSYQQAQDEKAAADATTVLQPADPSSQSLHATQTRDNAAGTDYQPGKK
jgi:hypothetical protein